MPWRHFLRFNAAGAGLWVGVWAGPGYLAGSHIGPIYEQIRRYELYGVITVGVALLVLLIRRAWRHRTPGGPTGRQHHGQPPRDSSGAGGTGAQTPGPDDAGPGDADPGEAAHGS